VFLYATESRKSRRVNEGNAKAAPSTPRLPKEDTNLSTTLHVPLLYELLLYLIESSIDALTMRIGDVPLDIPELV
jgi:hypothetical protein